MKFVGPGLLVFRLASPVIVLLHHMEVSQFKIAHQLLMEATPGGGGGGYSGNSDGEVRMSVHTPPKGAMAFNVTPLPQTT